MRKKKTKKSIKKRIKITGSGKILRMAAWRSHLKEKKSKKRKRRYKKYETLPKGEVKKIIKSL